MKIGQHVQFNKGNSKSKLQKFSLGERAYNVQRMKLSVDIIRNCDFLARWSFCD